MYYKLSLRSVKRSFSDFAVYFLTLTVGVCLFYVFNSISAQKVMLDMTTGQQQTINQLSNSLTVVSIFVSIILGFLCIFGNQFLLKRRKKEFGLYMTLGMSKSTISKILIIETSMVAILSLAMGLLLGTLVSQGMAAFTANLFDIQISNFKFVFSLSAMLKTIAYFTVIFIVVMIVNSIIISKYTILNLLTASKKNESIKLKKTWSATILWILSIISIVIGYVTIFKVGLGGSIVLLSIGITVIFIASFVFYFSASSVVFNLLHKRRKLYLKDSNMFVIRQIYSKVNTGFLSMTVISLMLFFTLSILSISFSYKHATEKDLQIVAPFDATVSAWGIEKESDSKDIEKTLHNSKIDVKKYKEHTSYIKYFLNIEGRELLAKASEGPILKQIKEGFPINIYGIKYSDYVNQMKLQGRKPRTIKEGETLIITNMNEALQTIKNFTSVENQIEIAGKKLHLPKDAYDVVGIETENVGRTVACFVLPDDINTELFGKRIVYNIKYNDGDRNESERLGKIFEHFLSDKAYRELPYSLDGITKDTAYRQVASETSTLIYVGIFIGVVFLIASGAVLALQQLSEASDSVQRYKSLKRIGATDKQIKKAIFKQVLIFFMVPLVLALSHTIFAIYFAHHSVVYGGTTSIALTSIISVCLFLVLYGAYFIATYFGYKKIVK